MKLECTLMKIELVWHFICFFYIKITVKNNEVTLGPERNPELVCFVYDVVLSLFLYINIDYTRWFDCFK